ncbi:hypothetical protein CAPTEDRAFT_190962 [Capitella teleta]|uniref:Reelin domain-containing protein n=1 Tax=Capitella teleta TaxID=283909 RepID=R7TIY9_CAPTE|nr:hypothetical protein CAPTEDRAFT_190962 [Capitella teleta]|eukprot:ELT93783.1 hypothetical protein CAPTEDRAFT_190962 [Capitella teleta]
MASLRVLMVLGSFGLFGVSQALINGMPMSGCSSLYPQHYADPQTSPAPYTFTATEDVTIETTDPDVYFRGFAIQGMVGGVLGGRFSLDEGENQIRLFECPGGDDEDNTATHVTNEPKYSVNLTYHPPEGVDPSQITFRWHQQ